LILWSGAVISQAKNARKIKIQKEKEKKPPSYRFHLVSWDLIYGQKIFAKDFYKQLSTFTKLNSNLPVKFIGIGWSTFDFYYNPRGELTFSMLFNYFYPQKIIIRDSINSNLSGFSYNCGWGKHIANKKRSFCLAGYVGFNAGFTKITTSTFGRQVNPFFSPKVALQPKVLIRRFAFSLIFDCEYDISNPVWRGSGRTEDNTKPINFNQTGLSVLATIGYRP